MKNIQAYNSSLSDTESKLTGAESRKKGKQSLIVNEWEKLTAPSYRRLSVQSLDTPLKIHWSIDRITIVGKLKEQIYYQAENDLLILNFEELMEVNEGSGYLERMNNNSWKLSDGYGENIAYIEILKFQEGQGRIDFNPNKISEFLASSMKNFIHDLFETPHFSRADIACDILDVPNEFITSYRVLDAVTYRPYFGRSGALESAYWGSRSSERQIRLYNKKLEQERKRKVVPKEIETWWRLELQLRRGKAIEWQEIVNESLDTFVSPFYITDDVKPTDRVMLMGLLADHSNWDILSRGTKYKYRNLMKEMTQNDELTQVLKSSFNTSMSDLKEELDTWLLGLDVTE